MRSKAHVPTLLIEPFAGGGIVSLTALFEGLVRGAVMAEMDEEIAAVWQSVVDGHANWLAERILGFDLSREALITELSKKPTSLRDKAFQTILKNRTFHGGILAEGSGLLKYGEKGRGVLSRWYPRTLATRFQNIAYIASKIDFRLGDGFRVMKEFADRSDVVFFLDPPYTAGGKKAGRRLYRHFDIDHEFLFINCETIAGDFLMTYDDAPEVRQLAATHGFEVRQIAMTNTHHATMKELVIGRHLSWMDSQETS